ncbi:hypothetical protein BKA69DRAFT_1072304 [Paraphysoderma sedebokerense]|nr:hypothetical protein BKA69DRAFT_1072304 [Paraphysoderma sedebokerense]
MVKTTSVIFTLFLVALTQLQLSYGQNCPNGRMVRKEFRDMSYSEWQEFVKAVKLLQQEPDNASGNKWASLSDVHSGYSSFAHSNLAFLIWHRQFLINVEKELKRVNPNFTGLPYWNWAQDANSPHKSQLWQLIGGSKLEGNKPSCIPDGPFADYRYKGECVTRGFDMQQGFTTTQQGPKNYRFSTWQELMAMINNNAEYSKFAEELELTSHVYPHIYVGGNMGTMTVIVRSFNDVAFSLHHNFVDYLLEMWIQKYGANKYGGYDNRKKVQHTADVKLDPFNVTPNQLLNLERDHCVVYQPYSGNTVLPTSSTSAASSSSTSSTSSSTVPPPKTTPTEAPVTSQTSQQSSAMSTPATTAQSSSSSGVSNVSTGTSSQSSATQSGSTSGYTPTSTPESTYDTPASSSFSYIPPASVSSKNTTPGATYSPSSNPATVTPTASPTSTPPSTPTTVPYYVTCVPENTKLPEIPRWYIETNHINEDYLRKTEERVHNLVANVRERTDKGEFNFDYGYGTNNGGVYTPPATDAQTPAPSGQQNVTDSQRNVTKPSDGSSFQFEISGSEKASVGFIEIVAISIGMLLMA